MKSRLIAILVATLMLVAACVHPGSANTDLTQLSIEDLMNIEVTSVPKKAERVSDSAAAVYVITQVDIRHSGITTIADALRMAPGLQVANINSHTWAISARGFDDRFANKMLALIDGRSVYGPLFAGTWWDVQDSLLARCGSNRSHSRTGSRYVGPRVPEPFCSVASARSHIGTRLPPHLRIT